MPRPVKQQPKTKGPKKGASSAKAEVSPPTNSKPWAAYALGHNSTLLRLWQCLFWVWDGEQDTDVGVPLALDQLREAATVLSDEIPPAFGRKLNSTCTQIAKLTEQRPPAHEGQERDWACWFRAEESAGHREWQSLVSLANSALPEGCPWHEWLRLGTAIAVFQQELFLQSPYGGPCELPSLRPVLDCAVKIFEQGYHTAPEIEGLARHILRKPWQPQPQILAGVVETPDYDLDCDLEPSETHRVLTWQMIRLNDQIRVSLRKTMLTPMVASENVARSGPTVRQQLVLTALQKAIWAALEGRGLTKQALANEVCGSEGTRLYKPGGIKELTKARVVANIRGVGYYRPDAPPAGTVILDQHQTGTN